MKKEMLINVLQPEECRIAIIEDGVLEELYVERTSHESYTGNIYKGRVVNLEPAIQAAFVDFSVGRNGFLHVSDVEAQYFDRSSAGHDEPAPAPSPRDRDRKRDPRRDRERGRGRDDRRPSPPPDASEPPALPPASPPRLEERPREKGREPQRDRDRDKDRGRERPDLSIRGRRDRSEPPPRRFGEGLVDPMDLPPLSTPAPPVPARPPIADELVMSHEDTETRTPSSSAPAWTEPEVQDWEPEITRQRDLEIKFGGTSERVIEREPQVEEVIDPRGREYWRVEPVDPDLPPSRTQRSRIPAVPAPPTGPGEMHGQERGGARVPPPSLREPRESQRPLEESVDPLFEPSRGRGRESERERDPRKGRGRGRQSPPQGRQRPVPPPDRDKPLSPGSVPGIGPDDFQGDLDIGEASRIEEPPRRRGGRAAIRSRGGEEGRPLDLPPAPDQGTVRQARAYQAPSDLEIDRGRPVVPERPTDSERRRTPEPPEPGRDRDRLRPHDRAGEPGYVPRRERLRSADSTFGAELFPSGPEWPERDIEPELEDEIDAGAQEVADEDEPGFLGDAGPAGSGGSTKNDGRRRRRRRGRRREPERGPAKFEPSIPSADERDSDSDEFSAAAPPSRSVARSLNPSLAGDLDELDLEEIDERDALDDDFIGDELVDERPVVVEEEIDLELEQEIRKEIEEIEELEREMGLRGPAEPAGRRGDEPARGGRPIRGRGLVKPPIQEIFRRGDEVLVQVIKESIGTKGPTLSTYISIPGRYLVLMPGLNRVGVSRKIVDESQRRKLREIMHDLNPPKGLGFIVRTAGLERTKRELARDLAYLLRLWKVILRRIKKSKAPTPIYQESDMIIRTIRDIFTSEIDTIWIDEPLAFERAQDFLKVVMPRFVNRLKLYDEKVPLFHKYGIEEEIAKIQRRHVPLPEGGSIVIDQTEALVAIDVNSGNFRVEDDAERTAYEMNLRAAKEIARQLRLRDLGGVIVNDFIDMREERHRRGVERALRESIQRDRARTKVLRMSAFGLIEMTRQRIRPSLKRSIYEDCSHCAGAGVAKTVESMAIDVMRLLALATHREDIRRIAISVNPHVATYLSNRKRKEIARIESECGMTIQVGFEPSSPAEFLRIECFDANNSEIRLLPSPAPSHKRGH